MYAPWKNYSYLTVVYFLPVLFDHSGELQHVGDSVLAGAFSLAAVSLELEARKVGDDFIKGGGNSEDRSNII